MRKWPQSFQENHERFQNRRFITLISLNEIELNEIIPDEDILDKKLKNSI